MYFGNKSKYRRSKPSCKLCNYVAYFKKWVHQFQIVLNSSFRKLFKDTATNAFATTNWREAKTFICYWRHWCYLWWCLLDHFQCKLSTKLHLCVVVLTSSHCGHVSSRSPANILRYQPSHPSGLAPQSLMSFRFCQCHPCHLLLVQHHRHLWVSLIRTPSDGTFRHFQTIRGLGSVLKAPGWPPSNGSPTTITAWSYPTTQYENTIPNVSTPDLQTVSAVMRPITPALAEVKSWVDTAMHMVVMKLKKV